jgi:hypothetical protein
MKQLLIVYHTLTGGTLQMARAAAAGGGREPTVRVCLETAAAAGPDALLEASGYLFACPENLAAMSGMMKDFFDRSYYPVLERLVGRPYATLICAGSDGNRLAPQGDRRPHHRVYARTDTGRDTQAEATGCRRPGAL